MEFNSPIQVLVECLLPLPASTSYSQSKKMSWFESSSTENSESTIIPSKEGDVNEQDEFHYTALHLAALDGDVEMMRFLVDLGADLHVKLKDGSNMLHFLAKNMEANINHYEVVEFLLENGVDVNEMSTETKETPFHLIAAYGSKAVAAMCLQYGADFSIKDASNCNVLHYAAANNEGVLKLLLNTGKVEVDATNVNGTTPLHVAAAMMNSRVAECLLDSGANAQVEDIDGHTPLHLLLESSVERRNEQENPEAISNENDYNLLCLLLKKGRVDINRQYSSSRQTILMDATLGNCFQFELVQHLAILEQLYHPISKANADFISSHSALQEYLQECRFELEHMRQKIVHGTVSFFNIMAGDRDRVACFMRNHELAQELQHIQDSFPIYFSTLEKSIKDGLERHTLRTKTAERLQNCMFFQNIVIRDHLFKYLSNHDFENICSCE